MKGSLRTAPVLVVLAIPLVVAWADSARAQAPKKAARAAAKKALGPARVPADLKVENDIVYKRVGDAKLELMLFLPLEKRFEKSPLVVYIHGGGWGNGDRYRVTRGDIIRVIRGLNERGVTCASIEYRLANGGKDTVMDSVADCLDALSFLAGHASEYGLDTTRIGVLGSSAGGHLSLMSALARPRDYPCDPAFDASRPQVRCGAAYYPLTTLVHPEVLKGSNFERPARFVPVLGGPLAERRDIALKLSPVELLSKESPPLLLVHGDQDATLSHQNSLFFCARAKETGAPAECLIVKGAGHGLQGTGLEPAADEIARRTIGFYLEHMGIPDAADPKPSAPAQEPAPRPTAVRRPETGVPGVDRRRARLNAWRLTRLLNAAACTVDCIRCGNRAGFDG
jgi:acetyl esterase/lipase